MEAVTVEDAKTYCRIENALEDTLLASMIVAARQVAEARCRRGMTVEDWPEGVPEQVRIWMLIWISTQYENREAFAEGKVYRLEHVDHLLDPYVVPGLA